MTTSSVPRGTENCTARLPFRALTGGFADVTRETSVDEKAQRQGHARVGRRWLGSLIALVRSSSVNALSIIIAEAPVIAKSRVSSVNFFGVYYVGYKK